MTDDKNKRHKIANCPHILNQHDTLLDVQRIKITACDSCDYAGSNLWVCLYYDCLQVGCSEQANDHSTQHFQLENEHCVHLNVSSQRAWCYMCECEVFPQLQRFICMQNPFAASFGLFEGSMVGQAGQVRRGLVGLQNIANTCYLNAALQALSNVPPMTHYFLSCADIVEHAAQHSKADLARSYYQLMREMWVASTGYKRDYLVPRKILNGIGIAHPIFRGYQQHDTQEFLRCFMDQLHEELKQQNAVPASAEDQDTISSSSSRSTLSETDYETCDGSTGTPDELHMCFDKANVRGVQRAYNTQLKAQNGKQVLHVVRSIISDIFDGKLLSSVQCLTCDRLSTREETFQDLSLPIPSKHFLNMLHRSHSMSMQSLNSIDSGIIHEPEGWLSWMWNVVRTWLWGPSVTLYDCMASFFSADELKGDNMYSCEKCNKLRTGIKYARILNLPEVLCIHLKRFHHDLSYSCKISKHVQFPLEGFDMRAYLDQNCTSHVTNYDLMSVICHHGSVGSGHYTCMARNSLTDRWYEYDDDRVTEVSADTVRNCQAYVLFYSKSNPQMELLRSEAIEISASHPPDTADMRFYITREWISRFYTFAEPGPINNWTILCPHGGILPSKMPLFGQIAVPVAQPLWDYLNGKFGGGPVLNIIFECNICMRAAEALARRQSYELNLFSKYNAMEFTLETDAIYAISLPWLRKWQQFARGLTSQEPGAISNGSIASSSHKSNGVCLPARSTSPARVRHGADYAQINGFLWRFLHEVYGGGPEIILRNRYASERSTRSASYSDAERPLWPDGESSSLTDAESGCGDLDGVSDSQESKEIPTHVEESQQQVYIKHYKHAKFVKSIRHSAKHIQKSKVLVPRSLVRKRGKKCILPKRKKILGKAHGFLSTESDVVETLSIQKREHVSAGLV